MKTASDGSYSAQGLPAGSYSYCAQVPGDGYLNGCYWADAPAKITLSTGQRSTGNTIEMTRGSILKIRLQDAANQANKKSKDGTNPPIRLGIWDSRGRFLPVHQAGRDNAGWDYQVTIPFDKPLKLQVMSTELKLSDGSGAGLSASSQTAFQHNSGDPNPKSFQFNVTGVNP